MDFGIHWERWFGGWKITWRGCGSEQGLRGNRRC
jgi:hypothetical protein